jgi:predicted DNA-binding protein
MGSSVSLRLPEDLKIRLEKLALRAGRSKTYTQQEMEKRYGVEH